MVIPRPLVLLAGVVLNRGSDRHLELLNALELTASTNSRSTATAR